MDMAMRVALEPFLLKVWVTCCSFVFLTAHDETIGVRLWLCFWVTLGVIAYKKFGQFL